MSEPIKDMELLAALKKPCVKRLWEEKNDLHARLIVTESQLIASESCARQISLARDEIVAQRDEARNAHETELKLRVSAEMERDRAREDWSEAKANEDMLRGLLARTKAESDSRETKLILERDAAVDRLTAAGANWEEERKGLQAERDSARAVTKIVREHWQETQKKAQDWYDEWLGAREQSRSWRIGCYSLAGLWLLQLAIYVGIAWWSR